VKRRVRITVVADNRLREMPVCCGRDNDRARRLYQIGMDKGSGNFWLDCNVPFLRDRPNIQNLALGMDFSKRTSIGELILVRRNDSLLTILPGFVMAAL